ncbi:MAG: hypothetical protein FJ218_11120 [Ignavibacteria bacterium]|nr:hypothetical protein [Ignavibacteria bacterium]
MNTFTKRILTIFLALSFFSCKKDPVSPTIKPPLANAKGVYVLNEGLFGSGTSSLSFYGVKKDSVYNDVFFAVNGRNLGDIGNDIKIRGTRAYIVVNNSNKIEIINTSNHQSVGTINIGAGMSPREIVFVNDSIALVTNLYDSSVVEVNLNQQTILKRIVVGANPEGIAITNGKAFVANSGLGSGSTLSIISLSSMSVSNTITIGDNPVSVSVDKDGEVYVLCAGLYNDFGNPNDDTPAKIKIVNASTEQIVDSILIGGHSFSMAIGTILERGYVCADTAIISLNTKSNTTLGNFVNKNYYAVSIDESNGDVYCADAKNFTTNGSFSIYNSSGILRKTHNTGVLPTAFAYIR